MFVIDYIQCEEAWLKDRLSQDELAAAGLEVFDFQRSHSTYEAVLKEDRMMKEAASKRPEGDKMGGTMPSTHYEGRGGLRCANCGCEGNPERKENSTTQRHGNGAL